jgi:1-acyl-sn-glycerol-3-phosphate acyltransferase
MAAKSELFRIPVWGRAMRIAGFVEINRSKGRESRKRLKAAAAALAEHGRSLWLAPEGTRGDGITLGEFKTGAFEMALELQLPIIPISIAGTAKILGRGKNKVERGVHVDVTVHPVVSPRDYPVDHHILRDQVRDTIRAALSHAS